MRRGRIARHAGAAAGLALVELVVAAALGGLVAIAALSLLATHGRIARKAQAALERVDEAAWAMAVLSRDIELAGADPARAGVSALVAARPGGLVLASDRDGDGRIDRTSRERLAIEEGGDGRLIRSVGRQRMALLAGLRAVRFRFFAASGEEIRGAGPGGALEAAALASVGRVEFEIAAGDAFGREVRLHGCAAIRRRLEPGGMGAGR